MYCVHCGIKLPAKARFCHQCGQAQAEIDMAGIPPAADTGGLICETVYQTTGERWGIFPRDIGEFQARLVTPENFPPACRDDTVILSSAKIEIMSCSFTPDQNNKRHRKAYEDLVQALLQAGWIQVPKKGAAWYNQTFRKPNE